MWMIRTSFSKMGRKKTYVPSFSKSPLLNFSEVPELKPYDFSGRRSSSSLSSSNWSIWTVSWILLGNSEIRMKGWVSTSKFATWANILSRPPACGSIWWETANPLKSPVLVPPGRHPFLVLLLDQCDEGRPHRTSLLEALGLGDLGGVSFLVLDPWGSSRMAILRGNQINQSQEFLRFWNAPIFAIVFGCFWTNPGFFFHMLNVSQTNFLGIPIRLLVFQEVSPWMFVSDLKSFPKRSIVQNPKHGDDFVFYFFML